MERRAIRDRIALDRHQAMRNLMLKGDLSELLEHRIKHLEASQDKKSTENRALMRNLLRGSKRRKRAIISEIQSGSLRRALSEDELGPGDEESVELEEKSNDGDTNEKNNVFKDEISDLVGKNQFDKSSLHPILFDLHASSDQRRRRHAGDDNVQDITTNLESLTVQSEFGFPSTTGNHHKRYLPTLNSGKKKSGHQQHNHNLSYYDNINEYHSFDAKKPSSEQKGEWAYNKDQELEVSDHPHLYQNTIQVFQQPGINSNPFLQNPSRRNSIR